MAKATAMRGGTESRRVSLAIVPATELSAAEAERQRADLLGVGGLAALQAALDAVGAPALIVEQNGDVVCSSVAAQALLSQTPEMQRQLSSVIEGAGLRSGDWEVTSVLRSGGCAWSLLVLRAGVAPAEKWRLTARQTDVLALVARGMTNTAIGETLGIGVGTVEFHIAAIFDKAGVSSRAALLASLNRQNRLEQLDQSPEADVGRPVAQQLKLAPGDRATLRAWLRSPNLSPALALRARIVLASGEGEGVRAVARRLGTTVTTVCAWRKRYRTEGMAGLSLRKLTVGRRG